MLIPPPSFYYFYSFTIVIIKYYILLSLNIYLSAVLLFILPKCAECRNSIIPPTQLHITNKRNRSRLKSSRQICFGKYFLKSKRSFWEELPKVKKGHFGKYFLKSKRSLWEVLPKVKKGHFGSTSYSKKWCFWEVLP